MARAIPDGHSYCAKHNEIWPAHAAGGCAGCNRSRGDSVLRLTPQAERFYDLLNAAAGYLAGQTLHGRIKAIVLSADAGRLLGLHPEHITTRACTIVAAGGTIEISCERDG